MARIAYFDCFSGCSGDMILGAFLDAGLDFDALKKGLAALDFDGYEISMEKVKRAAITATKFNVTIDDHGHHHHRGLHDILHIINDSKLSDKVKEQSSAIFRRLGEAEAKIHGITLEEVHFHELGAIDTIIDIVGTILALELLKIEHCYASAIPEGKGYISTAHGTLPAMAPATLELLAKAGAPIISAAESPAPPGELITPTGAVLVTSLAKFTRPEMKVEKIGYGAGGKDPKDWPNVLRIWLGEEAEVGDSGELALLETNIDDMNPQIFGYLMEKLLAEKAADVWFTPIQMKKNRPAIMLSVLCPAALESKITGIIMKETSTLGIRSRIIARHTAYREIIEFDSSLGRVHAKVKRFGKDLIDISPEYDDCRRIALERNLPLHEVSRIVEIEARTYLATQK
jgi:pyridinium-3,5-bisthiocarboxylic acid mononucleotide nickel chelatase